MQKSFLAISFVFALGMGCAAYDSRIPNTRIPDDGPVRLPPEEAVIPDTREPGVPPEDARPEEPAPLPREVIVPRRAPVEPELPPQPEARFPEDETLVPEPRVQPEGTPGAPPEDERIRPPDVGPQDLDVRPHMR